MSFMRLPPELVLRISSFQSIHEINALSKCCRLLFSQLNQLIYCGPGVDIAARYTFKSMNLDSLEGIKRAGYSLGIERGGRLLSDAVLLGYADLAEWLLNSGEVDTDSPGFGRETALLRAASRGRTDMVQLLLDHGVNPSAPRGWHGSVTYPLLAALDHSHSEVAEILIAFGADIHCRDWEGKTSLICAARNGASPGMLEMATLLLDRGVDASQFRNSGHDALWAAFFCSQSEPVAELILDRAGMAETHDINSFFQQAVRRGWLKISKLLIEKGADVLFQYYDGRSILIEAILRGSYNVAELLIQNSADVNMPDQENRVALHFTTDEEHEGIAKSLLAAGANVSALDEHGEQALDKVRWPAITALLLANGAQCRNVNNNGLSTLIHAIYTRNVIIVRMILEADPGILKLDINKEALHDAARCGHAGVVREMIRHGADISALDNEGKTPVCVAAEYDKRMSLEALLSLGADVDAKSPYGWTPLMIAASNNEEQIIRTLCANNANTEVTNDTGYTALLIACAYAQPAALAMLLEKGANACATTNTKGNGLTEAPSSVGGEDIVRILLEDGRVDVNHQDDYGRTPLLYAAMRGRELIVEQLLSGKTPADPTIKDHWGATPLSMAVRNGSPRIVERLLAALGPAAGSAAALREKDRHGRDVFGWAARTESGEVWRLLAALDDSVDIVEDAPRTMMRYNEQACFCDVCSRSAPCKGEGLAVCKTCESDHGDAFCICKPCAEDGVTCIRGHDTWKEEDCRCEVGERVRARAAAANQDEEEEEEEVAGDTEEEEEGVGGQYEAEEEEQENEDDDEAAAVAEENNDDEQSDDESMGIDLLMGGYE